MLGVDASELLVVLLVAFLVLGPKDMPALAHKLGRMFGNFRRMSTEFQRTLNAEIALDAEIKDSTSAAPKAAAPLHATTPEAPVSGTAEAQQGVAGVQPEKQPEPQAVKANAIENQAPETLQ